MTIVLKRMLAAVAALCASAAIAAVDVNKATESQLDALDGIGPVTSKLIMSERKKGEFKNWDDFTARVKGVGDNKAAKLSAGGLTVNGAAYASARAATVVDTNKKPVADKVVDGARAAGAKTKEVAANAADKTKEVARDTKAAVTPERKQ